MSNPHPLVSAKIIRIETIPLRVKMERLATGSTLKLSHRCTILTRIHTDTGIIGECFNGNDDALQASVIQMIQEEMAPALIGKSVSSLEDIWALTRKATEPFLRDRRIALRAQSCIDSALHDAIGKLVNLPINILWGGAKKEIKVFALGGYYREKNDLEGLVQEVEELKAFGIYGIKLKLGGKSPSEDAKRVEVVRKAAGDDFILGCDANQGWTIAQALEFTRITKDLNIDWLEEPCKWDNDRAEMPLVRSISGVPITAGQSELTRFGCRDLMQSNAIDICNFDGSWGGGPTEWRRVATLANCFGVKVMQHLEPQFGLMMSAGVANGFYGEVMLPWRDPFFYQLIANQAQRPFNHGIYTLPTEPGWGMVIDEDYLKSVTRV